MHRLRLLLVLLCALAVMPGTELHAETITGKVVGVADGDTLTLDSEGRRVVVRLSGIDAPERGRPNGQPFGRKSGDELRALALHQVVTVETHKQDRYGREVGTVEVGGKDLGLEQVRSGMAWVFRRYLKELPPARRTVYLAAEEEARAQRRGLWSEGAPLPPWEWRALKGHREQTALP
jgi:endonuclease YncB( thermonuclease family)